MPFNWFKRQFGGKKKDEAAQQESPTQDELKPTSDEVEAESIEETSPESPATDTSPANAEDYLQWAKAAYQNIQKQQIEDTDATEAAESPETETETEVDESSVDENPTAAEASEVADNAAQVLAEEEDVPAVDQDEPDTTETEPEASSDSALVEEESDQRVTQEQLTTTIEQTSVVSEAIETIEAVEAVETDIETTTSTEETFTSTAPMTDGADVVDSDTGLSADSPTNEFLGESLGALGEEVTEASGDVEEPESLSRVDESEVHQPDDTEGEIDEPEGEIDEPEGEIDEPATDAVDAKDEGAEAGEEAIATALPFWAKAEAERQERLERLKETAIEEPEEPEIELDEDFVWSAGVLASQGRKADEVSMEEITWLTKLRQGLGKTRRGLINELKSVVGQGPLNGDAVMEIESLLLQADVGIDATDYVIEALQTRMKEGALPPEEAIAYLKDILRGILDKPFEADYAEEFVPEKDCLNIWLLTGVNGAGKTTTIGKLAHMTRTSDYRCLIAAADTFRAAAVEQVKVWGERSGVDVIANPGKNTDPAAVVFDAISAAQAREVELLLVDTAGRLQNKKNLMAELSKIRRIVDKKAANAKVESLLVLDATLGQNGLRQAQVFSEAAKLSGVVLTKLDGSAKGGVALAVVQQLGLPIRFIGAGEGIEDLRPFSSYEFVEALLSG